MALKERSEKQGCSDDRIIGNLRRDPASGLVAWATASKQGSKFHMPPDHINEIDSHYDCKGIGIAYSIATGTMPDLEKISTNKEVSAWAKTEYQSMVDHINDYRKKRGVPEIQLAYQGPESMKPHHDIHGLTLNLLEDKSIDTSVEGCPSSIVVDQDLKSLLELIESITKANNFANNTPFIAVVTKSDDENFQSTMFEIDQFIQEYNAAGNSIQLGVIPIVLDTE